MQTTKQSDRWESSILAAALAVAGTLFLSDKLGSLMVASNFLSHAIQHCAPGFLAALGLLLFSEQQSPATEVANGGPRKGQYE